MVAANNSTITTYGSSKHIVDVGLKREYSWTHLLRGSEINEDLVIAALTIAHQQPTVYHDFGRLHFYSYIVDILVRIGDTWSARS